MFAYLHTAIAEIGGAREGWKSSVRSEQKINLLGGDIVGLSLEVASPVRSVVLRSTDERDTRSC